MTANAVVEDLGVFKNVGARRGTGFVTRPVDALIFISCCTVVTANSLPRLGVIIVILTFPYYVGS
jgi:hypothetical protein